MNKIFIEDTRLVKREDFPLGLLRVTTKAIYKNNGTMSDSYIHIKIHSTDIEGYTSVFKRPAFRSISIERQQSDITFYIENVMKISANNIERRQLYYSGIEYVKYECNIIKCIKEYFNTFLTK